MVTKRQLGFFVIAVGLLALLASAGVDLTGVGGWGEFGPLQRIGVVGGTLTLVTGLLLVRLGDRPA